MGWTPAATRKRAAALSRDFAERLRGRRCGELPGGLVGLEQEYRVTHGGETVDSRTRIHGLALGPALLDPADHPSSPLGSAHSEP